MTCCNWTGKQASNSPSQIARLLIACFHVTSQPFRLFLIMGINSYERSVDVEDNNHVASGIRNDAFCSCWPCAMGCTTAITGENSVEGLVNTFRESFTVFGYQHTIQNTDKHID